MGMNVGTVPKNGYSLELKLDDRFNLLGIGFLGSHLQYTFHLLEMD